jgi:hypothetical protein
MAKQEIHSRKHLTFEQAEGVEALPRQLLLKEITKELRAKVWQVISHSLNQHRASDGDLLYPPPNFTVRALTFAMLRVT